jgi:hypothetical protein
MPDRADEERLRSALDYARVPAALLPGARRAAMRHIHSADTLFCTVRAYRPEAMPVTLIDVTTWSATRARSLSPTRS